MPEDLSPLPRYPDLADRVAVVTGGSRGIGAAAARALAANGAAVAVVARDEQALAAVAEDIRAHGGRAIAVRADCTVEAELTRAVAAVTDELGPADILAAFAGGSGMPVPTTEESAAHWRDVLESDLTSTFLTTKAFIPAMIERHRGSIITMSSAAARQPAQSNAAYAAAKAGVIAYTRHIAKELGPQGVRVNCLAPSSVENEKMRTWTTEEQRRQLGASFPLQRIGQPKDVAEAALFLASDASSWITGVTLDVAGGKIMV
ncbi:MAG TPA: SDR family NAD(P)-dependent oxidoreductase [Solirubrobacteraceae bacterium]|nr:SDR family NAD(P)-dependent oxidoreductase [Solirubrobacteraceae bacterium]